jgi:hypothetical protein
MENLKFFTLKIFDKIFSAHVAVKQGNTLAIVPNRALPMGIFFKNEL